MLVNELFPGLVAEMSALVNRILPNPDPGGSKTLHSGWESQSAVAPSWITRLSDRATAANNEGAAPA